MDIIIWLVIGGLIGWVASQVIRTDGRHGLLLNVAVGIAGAVFGGWFLSWLVEGSGVNQGNISLAAVMVSLVGAVVFLIVVNLVRQGAVR